MPNPPARVAIRFAGFSLDPGERRLTRDGVAVPLAPRAFDVLVALVDRAGSLVSKEDLLQQVWRDTAVEEANLAVAISAIRKAIGPRLIETVPKHGYRFTGSIEIREATAPLPSALSPVVTLPRKPRIGWGTLLLAALLLLVLIASALALRRAWRGRVQPRATVEPVPAEMRRTCHVAYDPHRWCTREQHASAVNARG